MRSAPLAALLLALLAAPSSAARILVIGDSHTVGPFGTSLDAALVKQGHQVAVQAVCGASAGWWLGPKRGKLSICYLLHGYGDKASPGEGAPAEAPPLAKELLGTRPDVVVFALGSNGPSGTPGAAEKLLALMPAAATCFWVGPPPMPSLLAPIGQLYNDLPAAFSRANRTCTVIDSRALIKPSDASPNGHFYGQPARDWGDAVAKRVAAAAGPTGP